MPIDILRDAAGPAMGCPAGPVFIGSGEHALFAMVHADAASPRIAIAWCPPMLHEHATALRAFSLLADALSARGVASLRFDYRGSGDSAGASDTLTIAGAAFDTEVAVDWLARRMPGVPVVLAGVGAGAFPAAIVAERRGLPLMLWQPPRTGAEWLRDVYRRDAEERSSTLRFPFLAPSEIAQVPEGCLLGFRTSPALRRELMGVGPPPGRADLLVDLAQRRPQAVADAKEFLALPDDFPPWVGELDSPDPVPPKTLSRLAEILSDRLHWVSREST